MSLVSIPDDIMFNTPFFKAELLKNESLPHCLVPCCLDVLRALYPKEQDLIKLIVEIIHDLCDAVCDDDVQDGVIVRQGICTGILEAI